MSLCPCGSNAAYTSCCEPLLAGKKPAATAEALLRARYTAFNRVDMKFIERTHAPQTRGQIDLDGMQQWARSAEWRQLEILHITDGLAGDTDGEIEFKAHYRLQGKDCVLHEISQFTFKQNQWFYVDGHLPEVQQYVRQAPKVGRNDPCACGSGKKFKKCCGLAA
jgi:SEC-C motif-containing protein